MRASQGSATAFGAFLVTHTFTMNRKVPIPSTSEPTDETRFQKPRLKKPSPARASVQMYIRRGWPCRPRMCIGKKDTLKPMNMIQKVHLPSFSFISRPVNFGNQ